MPNVDGTKSEEMMFYAVIAVCSLITLANSELSQSHPDDESLQHLTKSSPKLTGNKKSSIEDFSDNDTSLEDDSNEYTDPADVLTTKSLPALALDEARRFGQNLSIPTLPDDSDEETSRESEEDMSSEVDDFPFPVAPIGVPDKQKWEKKPYNVHVSNSGPSGPHTTEYPFPISPIKPAIKHLNKPAPKKRKQFHDQIIKVDASIDWKCPNITATRSLDCGCDLPHTLRCSGDIHGLAILAQNLRESPYAVSLLDCTLKNVTFLSEARIFENITLHGLVISSGEIKRVHKSAFLGLGSPLQALGLPSNALSSVLKASISSLTALERLDLSNNKIKALSTSDFVTFRNLNYLELSDNQISSISQRTFTNLKKLETLKLGGNRLGMFPASFKFGENRLEMGPASLKSLGECYHLKHLDLRSNFISGPLTSKTLPSIPLLECLNLDRNLIKNIQNQALESFKNLKTLSLRNNQIDVLQDHAFYGLGSLEFLDLSYNGIVAVSGASLQHLSRLAKLDLTHNFLRALTSDLIAPLPSLKDLRLGGNDISIVARNALDGAKELTSISLEDNPLSCDCSVRSFAEWLSTAKIPTQDLLGATCATPPHLEGAPLSQIPIESLNCDSPGVEDEHSSILDQLETLSRENNSHNLRDLSEKINLRDLHFAADYGLILTWIVNLSKEYTCDAIFVFTESNKHDVLVDKSQIHCEIKSINGQNTVSVIVPESAALDMDESYRFCLILVQENNVKSDAVSGCSNATKLHLSNESTLSTAELQTLKRKNLLNSHLSDIEIFGNNYKPTQSAKEDNKGPFSSFNTSFLPGLGVGILLTSVFAILWGATKLRSGIQRGPTITTCYAASDRVVHHLDPENDRRPTTIAVIHIEQDTLQDVPPEQTLHETDFDVYPGTVERSIRNSSESAPIATPPPSYDDVMRQPEVYPRVSELK